ncbi:MAG: aromatic ring-hydroxylating dioxygenase subunit alpha [Proteobacteria bacterium]|nr:aromatic ring-hydroxylating dioxygenase subunit alpha [Pseudomonadota bacterium]
MPEDNRTDAGPKKYADRDTPLIENQWYVAAWSYEVTRELMRRWILGKDLLLYRTEAGKVVILQNRCAHRSFPLSKGHLEGDNIVCGYHGISYDSYGRCVRVPSNQNKPVDIRIKRYTAVERPPWIWIWLGDDGIANDVLIPDHHWLSDPGWDYEGDYTHVSANYIGLHETFVDLTHFPYLHAGNMGSKEYAEAPFDVEQDDMTVRTYRLVKDIILPDFYSGPMGLAGVKVDRSSDSCYLTPGYQVAHAKVINNNAKQGERREYNSKILHAITPQSRTSTHYFWAVARDYAQENKQVARMVVENNVKVFQRYKDTLQWIEEITSKEECSDFRETNLRADRAGLAMRQIIQRLADEQASVS